MSHLYLSLWLVARLAISTAHADDSTSPPATSAPPMSRHQMMKDCMAKQKASDGGMPKEEMKKACKDVTATEHENEETEKKEEAAEKPVTSP